MIHFTISEILVVFAKYPFRCWWTANNERDVISANVSAEDIRTRFVEIGRALPACKLHLIEWLIEEKQCVPCRIQYSAYNFYSSPLVPLCFSRIPKLTGGIENKRKNSVTLVQVHEYHNCGSMIECYFICSVGDIQYVHRALLDICYWFL